MPRPPLLALRVSRHLGHFLRHVAARFALALCRFNDRELLLGAATAQLLIAVLVVYLALWPAWMQWHAQRTALHATALRYAHLLESLASKEPIAAQHVLLPSESFSVASDQITLSQFLQRIETAARRPRLAVVSMKPSPPAAVTAGRAFPVKLSVNAPLLDLAPFVAALLAGPEVVSLDSFTLRGLPGSGSVDATLSLRLIKLHHRDPASQPRMHPLAAPVTEAGNAT